MRALIHAGVVAFAACLSAAFPVHSATILVTPVTIDVVAPAGAGLLKLRNEGSSPVDVQLRVFKWTQQDGKNTFAPTSDVVASPPMTHLEPGQRQTVRVVLVTKLPSGQGSYRLFIDEIPKVVRRKQNGVRFLVRQSVPVFFSTPTVTRSRVSWTVSRQRQHLVLVARNDGQDRLKVSSLVLKDRGGKVIAYVPGLAGYVLGESTRVWDFSIRPEARLTGGAVALSAETDKGTIRVDVSLSPGG